MQPGVTFEQIEQLVAALSPQEQLQLAERISERLNVGMPQNSKGTLDEAQFDAFLRLCEEQAADSQGDVDAVEDLQVLREQRAGRL